MIVLWIFRKGFCVKETLCKYKRKSQVVFQKRQRKGVNFRLIQKSVRIGSLETKELGSALDIGQIPHVEAAPYSRS